MKARVLIVEDHPSVSGMYQSAFNESDCGYKLEFTTANNCESAYKIITDPNPLVDFEVVFLDLSLPEYLDGNINDGEDLAILIRKKLPHAKIIILTSHSGIFKIHNIDKKINPEGFLMKCDFKLEDLVMACTDVLNGGIYRSVTVQKFIKDMFQNGIYFDIYNQKIIYLLSQGIRTKNMPSILGLSVSTIDKRKTIIKSHFNIETGGDEAIVAAAKLRQYI